MIEYLEFLFKEKETSLNGYNLTGIYNKEDIIKKTKLDNPFFLRRYAIYQWLLMFGFMFFILAVIASEFQSKIYVFTFLVASLSLFIASLISKKITGDLKEEITRYKSKEWEKYTGIKDYIDDIGYWDFSKVDKFMILSEDKKVMEKLKELPSDEKRRKFLKRLLTKI